MSVQFPAPAPRKPHLLIYAWKTACEMCDYSGRGIGPESTECPECGVRFEYAVTMYALSGEPVPPPRMLLVLDWGGERDELLIGRHPSCDVVLSALDVSRRHAKLTFGDGNWTLQDLDSKNGTVVNGVSVRRCRLRLGDHLDIGKHHLIIRG